MQVSFPGSMSAGGLSSLLQHSGSRSRGATESWPGAGRGDRPGWLPEFAGGGVGSGPPPMTSASWTKVSSTTRAACHAPANEKNHAQHSTAEFFSGTGRTDVPNRYDRYTRRDEHTPPIGAVYAGEREPRNRPPADKLLWEADTTFGEPARVGEGISTKIERRIGEAKAETSERLQLAPSTTKSESADVISKSFLVESSDTPAHSLETIDNCFGPELNDDEYDIMCRREDRPCIFAPKTICVISRFPIYAILRRFLRHLYAISLSWSGVPLERYISVFVASIPMPPPGVVKVLLTCD